jgi:hypothetical protein
MAQQSNQLNLASLFRTVAGSLANQRESLNQADTYNHDHGDNMVEVFNVISQAMQAKRNADPADQLEYASQLLRQQKSGSAQIYAQGLKQASKEFQGQKHVTTDSAMQLIQALMGGGQASSAPAQAGIGDLLGSLLGGAGAGTQQPQTGGGDLLGALLGGGSTGTQQPQAGGGDMLGALLGSLTGTQSPTQNQPSSTGIDAGDLLSAGMAFLNTKSQGGSNMEAIVNAVVSGSSMGNSAHRSQSGALVVNSLLQAISGMSGKR